MLLVGENIVLDWLPDDQDTAFAAGATIDVPLHELMPAARCYRETGGLVSGLRASGLVYLLLRHHSDTSRPHPGAGRGSPLMGGSIRRFEAIELGEEGLVVDVVRTVTGE